MSGTITMTGEEYDALRAEAEALRAENEKWQRSHQDIYEPALRDAHAYIQELRAELEEARGLLDQRIPCDVMLPPASRIKRGCTLRTVLASIKLREDVAPNQRVFTATPAPEVQAEQGERHVPARGFPAMTTMTAPEEIHNVSQSQFSVARHFGGCTYMGQTYIYDAGQDRLIRRDVYLAKLKEDKA